MKQLIFLGAILFLFSCSNEDPNALIDPSDPDAISEVLITPDGSSDNSGDPPDTSTSSQAPEAINSTPSVLSSNGSTAPLNFRYNNVNGNLGGCYVQNIFSGPNPSVSSLSNCPPVEENSFE